ncbi:MAG: glycosyltransferase [Planctomycetes bacterium]|nr:glycosyltransferase [Planctomycetota bacterium]
MLLPRVSVIIPAFNAERYLRETLQSVLAQTYRDLEVIVVDDGSTDGTAALAETFASEVAQASRLCPVRVIRQANAGPSAARNRGIREARGELIAFLDSDDLWLPDKLAEQVPLFGGTGVPPVGLVYCHAERMDSEGRPLPTAQAPKPVGRVFKDFLLRNHCPTSAAVVRRQCFEACGYLPEDMVWAEDWHLWLRLARRYDFAAVPRILVRHRVHPGALTKHLEKAYLGARRVLETALEPGDPPGLRAARRRGLHRLDRNQALNLLALGETRSARSCFRRAIANGPGDPHAWAGLAASLLPAALRRPLMRAWKRRVPWLPWDPSGRAEARRWTDEASSISDL